MRNPTFVLATSGILALSLAASLPSQGRGAGAMAARLDAKLAEPWVRNALWITDFAVAKAMAARSGKHIFAYFTRSYAP